MIKYFSYSHGFSLYNNSNPVIRKMFDLLLKPVPRKLLFGNGVHQKLQMLKETEKWTYDQLQDYQNKYLKKLIQHCYDHVPYYRLLFKNNHLTPQDIKKIDDLGKIPILTKDIIRKNYDQLIANNHTHFSPRVGYTSGTTGKPLKFLIDQQNSEFEYASIWRNMSWFGINNLNARIATLRGDFVEQYGQTQDLWRYNSLIKELCFNGYDISEKNIEKMLFKLNAFQPDIIRGFPHILFIISQYITQKGFNLQFKPTLIYLSSENVLEHMKQSIVNAFDTQVMDRYGQAEYVLSIANCDRNTYHQNMEISILEMEGSESLDSHSKKIIGTCLWNYSMPFLRYDLEDLIECFKPPYQCECGRELFPIARLNGRVNDYIKTRDGRYISGGAFDHFLKHRILNRIKTIPEYLHVIQEDYENFTVELYYKDNLEPRLEEVNILKNGLLELFGRNTNLKIQRLHELPGEKKWKLLETKIKERIF